MAVMPANQFSILAGASGCGKTTLLLQAWAMHEQKQKFPIQFPPHITHAATIIADRTKTEALHRCAHLNIRNMEVYGLVDDLSIAPSSIHNPSVLWNLVTSKLSSSYQLLFVDPLGLFMEGSLIDYKSVAITLIRFNRYAAEHSVTMMGIHHTAKARTDSGFLRPQDRISGSGAFPGYSSTQCMMIEGLEKDSQQWDDLIIVPHMTPRESYKLVRRLDGYFAIHDQEVKKEGLQLLSDLKVMRLDDFKSALALKGLTDPQIKEWVESEPNLRLDGDYIISIN